MKKHVGITIALNPGKAAMITRILVSKNQPCLRANCKVKGDIYAWTMVQSSHEAEYCYGFWKTHLDKDYHLVMTNLAMERSTYF